MTKAPATGPAAHPAPTPPAIAAAPLPNLLAAGNDEFFWAAQVMPLGDQTPPGTMTRIYVRSNGSDTLKTFDEVTDRVISMAGYGSRLAVLCKDGAWLVLSESDSVSGKSLPDGAKMLALANDGETLWAIGVSSTPPAAATQPATAPAAVAPTANTPAATAPHLALYVFDGASWQSADGAAFPPGLPIDAPLSLAIIDHYRYLAIRREDNTIQVLKQSPRQPQVTAATTEPVWLTAPRSPWEQTARVPATSAFKLLSQGSAAMLWLADAESDRLMQLQSPGHDTPITLVTAKAPVTERACTYANAGIHEVALVDGKLADLLVDLKYDPKKDKPPNVLLRELPGAQAAPGYSFPFRVAISVALGFAILSSIRRRDGQDQAKAGENLALADPARRLLAGLIDASPFAVPVAIFLSAGAGGHLADAQTIEVLTLAGAFVVYLVHTAASEALTGRTVGKMLLGLRVMRTDGGTPDAAALLIRNFLRVVDIPLVAPLVFILFSPLRQRIGDVAAGTIVIRDRVRPEGNLVEPPKEDSSTSTEPPAAAED